MITIDWIKAGKQQYTASYLHYQLQKKERGGRTLYFIYDKETLKLSTGDRWLFLRFLRDGGNAF